MGGELPYAGQNGYQQSSVTIQTAIDLVYSDGYHADKLKKIAVNRNNVLQCEYTRIHYPDAEILEYDGIDKCIRAIKRGEAGCTLVEALRAVRLLGEDKSLEMLPLTDTCGFCFGVSYGDTGLLRVLSHGLSILGDDYGISHAYQYVGDITSYNMRDFIARICGSFTCSRRSSPSGCCASSSCATECSSGSPRPRRSTTMRSSRRS